MQKKILISCHFCFLKEFKFKNNANKQKKANGYFLCQRCAQICSKKQHWPEKTLQKLINRKPISWNEFLLLKPSSINIKVNIQCIQCKNEETLSSKMLQKRKLAKDELCSCCALSFAINTKEWRKNNSNAQLKVQSTAKQKLKNSQAQKKRWANNPKLRENLSKEAKKRWHNADYVNKHSKAFMASFSGLAGYFLYCNPNNKEKTWILFDSSYELCFLKWMTGFNVLSENLVAVRRCQFFIPYLYQNNQKRYFPDYALIYKDTKILIEIKSNLMPFYNEGKTSAKNIATENWIHQNNFNNFIFIDEDHKYASEINFKRSSYVKPLCKELYSQGHLFLINNKKTEKYIGKDAITWQEFQKIQRPSL